jgi:four helix bundle protein
MEQRTSSRGAVYSFQNLELYQRARGLGIDSVRLAQTIRIDDSSRVLVRQFVASATSIAANVAEGHGRYSRAAYRNHLSIARGSAAETQHWIDTLRSLDLIDGKTAEDLIVRCNAVIAAITALMRRLGDPPVTRMSEDLARYSVATPPSVVDGADFDDPNMLHALMLDAQQLAPEGDTP